MVKFRNLGSEADGKGFMMESTSNQSLLFSVPSFMGVQIPDSAIPIGQLVKALD